MPYHIDMTMTGTTVPAVLSGQLNEKPITYSLAPHERKRISFDVVEMPVWGAGRYGYTYRTTYLNDDGSILTRFDQSSILPPEMIAEAHQL
jgi:hypothetical protein